MLTPGYLVNIIRGYLLELWAPFLREIGQSGGRWETGLAQVERGTATDRG